MELATTIFNLKMVRGWDWTGGLDGGGLDDFFPHLALAAKILDSTTLWPHGQPELVVTRCASKGASGRGWTGLDADHLWWTIFGRPSLG